MMRRILWLVTIVGGTAAVVSIIRWRAMSVAPAAPAPAQWPSLGDPPAAAASAPDAPAADGPSAEASSADGPDAAPANWVAPVDGQCPIDHPVKANDNSGIFHVPGGRSYERTRAERCYVDATSAAADGYRAAKA